MTEEAFYVSQSTSIADPRIVVEFIRGGVFLHFDAEVMLYVRTSEAAHSLLDAATQIAAWFDSREAKPEVSA